MADLSDVLDMIYQHIIYVLYPNGATNPSIADVDITIVKGWPIRQKLDEVMRARKVMISIFPGNEERNTTRFLTDFKPLNKSAATLTAIVSEQTITIGGTVSVPQAIMVRVDDRNPGYAYQVQENDSLSDIAMALAAIIPNASAVDNVITVTGAHKLSTGIATAYTAGQSLGQQERIFKITIWSPTPDLRSVIASPIDIYFRKNYQIPLNDGFYARLKYVRTSETDDIQIPLIYRRDLNFRVEYETTSIESFTTITDVSTTLQEAA